ncbi:MAG: hypothetical protein LQ352_008379 [Teloschistes flavicans]|nr:MAG: hypothetical protein LQ352_008379 [Teloschistes flavicans]
MSESILEMEEGLRRGNDKTMEGLIGLTASTFSTWFIISVLSGVWHQYIEQMVPKPYLDEFFHVQQAELYLQGHFSEWHPKITTPPGLYGVSMFYLGVLSLVGIVKYVNVADLRHVWSVVSVLITFQLHQKKCRRAMIAGGIFSLFFRQTNIFWVAIFLGGLEIIRKVERGRSGVEFPEKPTLLDIVAGSWQHSRTYDPLISQANFSDYVKTALSLVTATLAQLPQLFRFLKPYLIILGAFGWFVLWNEGVVLGKTPYS